MANPPFNVDGVETKKIESQVDEAGRLPFGLPGTNAKTGAISNANSLWIQYFYAYLNDTGRAGFVMASSASDSGNKDRDIREKLVKTGDVDVMVGIGNKFFYTRSLPCTLWFFNKGKPKALKNQVLMIDARSVYHVVSARSHVFTEEQLANLNAIVWLYRGERQKFCLLVDQYQRQVDHWLAEVPARIAADSGSVSNISTLLKVFAEKATLAELNTDQPKEAHITQAALDAFKAELAAALKSSADAVSDELVALLKACSDVRGDIAKLDRIGHAGQVALQAELDKLAPKLKAGSKLLEARHKLWLKLLDTAEKGLRARLSKAFDGKVVRDLKRALLAADTKKSEAPTVRDDVLEALKQAAYFIHQVHWLHSRFPEGKFADVSGLCKAVTRIEIANNDYSLTPGRYVGTAPDLTSDDDDFEQTLRDIHEELIELNDKAVELAGRIGRNFEVLLG
jgi:type I restriction enzyme M protein